MEFFICNATALKHSIFNPLGYTHIMEISIEDVFAFLRQIHIFGRLTDEEQMAVAEDVEVFAAPAGEGIYQPGDKADGLYFLFRGKVRVSAPAGRGGSGVSRVLSAGDFFGEESLVYGQDRLTQATARADSIILRASRRTLESWIEDFPVVITPLRLIQESFLLVYNRSFNWLTRGEKVRYASRRTRFILWKKLLVPAALVSIFGTLTIYLAVSISLMLALLSACFLVVPVPWAAWLVFDWLNDFLVITNHRVVSQEKVILLHDTRQETPLEAVQAFGIETDQWGRWFGYGTIVVRSFTGNQYLKEIDNPQEVITILEEALERTRSRREEADRKAAEMAVKNRLGMEGVKTAKSIPLRQDSFFEEGALPGWLANLFQMRRETGGAITYRTHWIKLIQSAFLPALALLVIPPALAVALGRESLPVSPGALTLLCALAWMLALGIGVYRYIDWHNDCYIISTDQIVDIYRKPLGIEERRTASYSSILGIEYTRKGLMGLLFNYGTVYIKVGDSNFTFDDVHNPSLVQQELFKKMNQYNLRQRKTAAEEERQRMADFIESYHVIRGKTPEIRQEADEKD